MNSGAGPPIAPAGAPAGDLPARVGDAALAVSGAAPPPAPRRRVLFFRASGEWFALGLEHVREVCPRAPITRVPRAPAQVVGVMNLRGRVVTVVDLARCLGLPADGGAALQLVLLELGDPELSVGLLAERIDQVVDVEALGGGGEAPDLLEVGGRVATRLDPARVLGPVLAGGQGDMPRAAEGAGRGRAQA